MVSQPAAGLEVSTGIGHFLLEGRYYMGLSDFYKNSKRDFFRKISPFIHRHTAELSDRYY